MLPASRTDRFDTIQLSVRPLIHAYFFSVGDMAAVEALVPLVCSQWGGIRNLLVPVNPAGTIHLAHQQFLQAHSPDVVVDCRNDSHKSAQTSKSIRTELEEMFPWRSIAFEEWSGFERRDRAVHVAHSIPEAIRRQSSLALHTTKGRSRRRDRVLHKLLFGAPYENQTTPWERYSYQEFNLFSQVVVTKENFIEEQLKDGPFESVLNFTSHNLQLIQSVNGTTSTHFDIVVGDSIPSYCFYWNLRAIREGSEFDRLPGRRVLFFPRHYVADRAWMDRGLDLLAPLLEHQMYVANVDLVFCCWDEKDYEIARRSLARSRKTKRLADRKIRFTKRIQVHANAIATSDRDRGKPHIYAFAEPLLPRSFMEGIQGKGSGAVRVSVGRNHTHYEPTPDLQVIKTGADAIMDLRAKFLKSLPRSAQVAGLIRENSWFGDGCLSWRTRNSALAHSVGFSIPEEFEALKAYFQDRGYSIRLSSAAKCARGILELASGWSGFKSVSSRACYEILELLAVRSARKLSQEISNRTGENADSMEALLLGMGIEHATRTSLPLKKIQSLIGRDHKGSCIAALDALIRAKLVQRGYVLECKHCATKTWTILDEVGEHCTCRGCGDTVLLEPFATIEFGLNALVNRAMDQDALPALYALNKLNVPEQGSCVVPGLELLRDGRVAGEFDFVFVRHSKLHVGECKAGPLLKEKDHSTAEFAARVGASDFYFCTTAPSFSPTALSLIAEATKSVAEKAQVTVLQGGDLLPSISKT